MKNIKKSVSVLLVVLLLIGVFPMTGLASSAEIWPGFPGVDELPPINEIPDPFMFFNVENDPTKEGYVSSPEEWTARRNEIKDLVQRYWLGYRWPTKAEDVVGEAKEVMEENVISIFWGPTFNVSDEFNSLVEKISTSEVEIREVIPASNFFEPPTLGEVAATFGPASDPEEAKELAIKAWNAGYYIPYQSFFSTAYCVFVDYTGHITAPPEPYKPVMYNTVTVKNPDNNMEASFNIDIQMPTVTEAIYAWEDVYPSVTEAVYWDDMNLQVPVIIDIGGAAASHISDIKSQGYAYINFTPTDIYPDDAEASDGINRQGVYTKLYPYNKDEYEYASGALMAWGWGASQIISALEQPMAGSTKTWGEALHIDPSKTLVTGHSRYGKAAMFAAAFDERFNICLASEPGGSGIQSYRYKVEGKIFNFNTYPKADRVYGKTEIPTVSYGEGNSWFPETAGNFVNKDNQLPFDSSDIISLVAPRVFFTLTGIDTHWLGNEGGVAAVQAASEVYSYIGENEVEKGNIAVRARESNHVLYKRDISFVIAIMDREFKQTDDTKLHVQDLFPDGNGLGNMSYPAKDYNSVSEFNSYPFEINSSYLPWSRPDKYTLCTAQENFLVGYPVTITAQSNSPNVNLFLPNGTKINATYHEDEEFTFDLTAEQAVYGRYELRTDGDDKENRSVFFAAVSLADSLRHATSKGDEGEENRLIGFSSRLKNNIDNPPEVYVDGNITTMSFTPERFKTEETTLLEYGVLFHDKLFASIAEEGWDETKTFNIKNLQFVTIPEFTFEISFGNIKASAGNSGKEFASDFTQPISWNVERYNNGPAKVWPEIPDTKEERAIVDSGGTVSRPDAPEPKATDFDTKITSTKVERDGGKTNINIYFDSELDTREFGFGFDITDQWETVWSEDKKQVTLSIDYNKFPIGTIANLIIFRLKDVNGNMIPCPEYLSFCYPDEDLVNVAITAIQGGTYKVPTENQTNQKSKTAWVQSAVDALIPEGNGSVATVTYDNGYNVSVTKGQFTKSVTINVAMEKQEKSDSKSSSSSDSKSKPTPIPEPFSTVSIWPHVEGNIGTVKIGDAKANEMMTNNITMEIKHVKDIGAYSVSLPVESLTDANGDGVLNVKTNFGTITMPNNMLSNLPEPSGKEAMITIGEGDKSNLSEKLQAALGDRPIIELTVSIDGQQLDWDNPNAPVSVTIPYKPTEEELKNPDNIVVWYIDSNGEVVTVPNGRYDVETNTVTFKTTHFSLFAVTYVEKKFNDIGKVEWARKSIEALVAKNIMMTDEDNFYPSENITRADFLYALVRALDLTTTIDDNFEDVSQDAYYYNEVAIAKQLGITLGTGNNKFSPDLSITRQEMMTLTGRTLMSFGKLEQPDSKGVLDIFTDKSEIASYAIDSVAALVSEGLIVGSNNKIMPKNNTSRAEAAEFVYRLYNNYK